MAKMTEPGLFSGVNSIIDELLEIPNDVKDFGRPPRFASKAAAELLTQARRASNVGSLVDAMYNQMLDNWRLRNVKAVPSEKLWVPS